MNENNDMTSQNDVHSTKDMDDTIENETIASSEEMPFSDMIDTAKNEISIQNNSNEQHIDNNNNDMSLSEMIDTVKNEILTKNNSNKQYIDNNNDDMSLSEMIDAVKNEIPIKNSDIDDTVEAKIVPVNNEVPLSDLDETIEAETIPDNSESSLSNINETEQLQNQSIENSQQARNETFESELDGLISQEKSIIKNYRSSGLNHNYFLDSILRKNKDDNSFELSEEDMEALSQNVIAIEEQRQQSIQELAHNSLIMYSRSTRSKMRAT